MSTYTTQLRWIVERKQQEAGADPDDFSPAYDFLGLDRYPIFDENYRSILNDKIIRHFYFREIGFETAGQFAWFLRRTMDEHMPYFNKLYLSESIVIDPITNKRYSWTETYELAQGGSTTTDTESNETTGRNVIEHVDDDLTHGKKAVTQTQYGRTDTDTTTFGKKTDTDVLTTFGKTEADNTTATETRADIASSTTTFGHTVNTVNGGSDTTTEGSTHERVVSSDTPMNLINSGDVEALNYATNVTYTDREGETGSVSEYGSTVAVTNGGSDTTSSTDNQTNSATATTTKTDGGTESVGTDVLESGTESVSKAAGGTDTETVTNSGKDSRDIDTSRSETGTRSGDGSTSVTRDLDESGERAHNISGYDGVSPADLLKRWRETFLNIDMQVIGSLETLFFGLWN